MAVERTPWSLRLLAGATILASIGMLAANGGNPLTALVPPLLVALATALVRLPFPSVAAASVFFALVVDDVRARPQMGRWQSPLFEPGRLIYDALEKLIGDPWVTISGFEVLFLPGLKLFGIEILFLVLLVLLALTLARSRHALRRPPSVFVRATLVALVAVLLLEGWGMLRGGDLRFSMLQMRPMVLTGLGSLVLAHASPRSSNVRLMLGVVVAAATLRALVGLYYLLVIEAGLNAAQLEIGGGRYLMTHADSVLLVVALFICISTGVAWPNRASLLLNVTLSPLLAAAIVVNNRRLAFVSFGLGLLAMYASVQGPLRRRVNQLALILLPLGALYLVAGWSAQGLWAQPARTVHSLFKGGDASTSMRDIENYNLIVTARQHPLLGSGFGHEYVEVTRAFSIESFLEAYRYIPHNSLLWLASAGGVIGFTMFWWLPLVGVFLAALVLRHARSPLDQVVAQSAIAAVIAYGIQCFGDMGMQSWLVVMVLITMLGLVASRAAALGVWPEPRAVGGDL